MNNAAEKDCLPKYKPVVLIAQNDVEVLRAISECAKKFDRFNFDTAITGLEIIEKVNKKSYDAVVMGLKFPDITGTTVAMLIYDFDSNANIAFLTSYDSCLLKSLVTCCDFLVWSRNEKMQDTEGLCRDIYNLAMRGSQEGFSNIGRLKKREDSINSIVVPQSLQDVLSGRIT
jgi:CheY-like chemotaxis protein